LVEAVDGDAAACEVGEEVGVPSDVVTEAVDKYQIGFGSAGGLEG